MDIQIQCGYDIASVDSQYGVRNYQPADYCDLFHGVSGTRQQPNVDHKQCHHQPPPSSPAPTAPMPSTAPNNDDERVEMGPKR